MAGSMVSSCCWLEEVEGSGWDVLSLPLPSGFDLGAQADRNRTVRNRAHRRFMVTTSLYKRRMMAYRMRDRVSGSIQARRGCFGST